MSEKPLEENIFRIKKNFVNPDSVSAIHANEATVNNTTTEFFLTFYRLEPPIIFGDEDRQKVKEAGSIDAIAVSKIVMTPSFAKAFSKVLTDQLKTFDNANEAIQAANTNEDTDV